MKTHKLMKYIQTKHVTLNERNKTKQSDMLG